MGLSEREQQLLDELEKSLSGGPADTAKRKLASSNVSARRVIFGTLIVVAGLSTLLAGVMNQVPAIGLVGFALMLGGVYLAASNPPSK
jgi:predicted phage tail protein